jgi:2-oxoglutarate ferredoxin oxidoreductase subunit delta
MPEARKPKGPRGVVAINIELCKGCGFCIAFCPVGVLEVSEDFNSKGYHPPRIALPDTCTGCGLCGMYCPDFAIFGVRVKDVA